MGKHLAQPEPDRPARQRVDGGTAWERKRDTVGEPAPTLFLRKFVAVDPSGERAVDELVHKQFIAHVLGVRRHPGDAGDPNDDARAWLNASRAADHRQGRKRRREQLEGVLTFVKCEHRGDRRVYQGRLHKLRHKCHGTDMYTAIVTGGTKGIGFAIAKALLDAGGRVMVTGRDQAGVDAAVTQLREGLSDAQAVAGKAVDVRDRSAVEGLIDDTVRQFGSLNTLINNAGVGAFAEVEKTTDEDWHRVMDTNLTGVFYCTRAALPHLRRAGSGWIINIASLAGRNYFANGAAYCASKAGLVAFTESLMLEVRQDNIRVSVVMPGSVATNFMGPSGKHEDESWKLTPDDVAQTVVDLLRHPSRSLPSKVELRPARTR